MIGFIVAVIAGFLIPHAEEPLGKPLAQSLRKFITVDDGEIAAVSVILMSVLAGLAAVILHSGSPFWIAIGVGVGYFGTRIVAGARQGIDGRRDKD